MNMIATAPTPPKAKRKKAKGSFKGELYRQSRA